MLSDNSKFDQRPHPRSLTVGLGGQTAGIPLGRVEEIIGLAEILPVLQPPDYATGFLTMRGCTIPVADLRVAFGLKASFTTDTRIIVVRIANEGGKSEPMALVVDRVEGEAALAAGRCKLASAAATGVASSRQSGVAASRHLRQPLLDLDRLFAGPWPTEVRTGATHR